MIWLRPQHPVDHDRDEVTVDQVHDRRRLLGHLGAERLSDRSKHKPADEAEEPQFFPNESNGMGSSASYIPSVLKPEQDQPGSVESQGESAELNTSKLGREAACHREEDHGTDRQVMKLGEYHRPDDGGEADSTCDCKHDEVDPKNSKVEYISSQNVGRSLLPSPCLTRKGRWKSVQKCEKTMVPRESL